ncbi:hypothetical protein [Sedimentibacter sp.]|uniref:hypothetical protein n=1 Tax=Sedimentibacter sp. TaxID=1960295 RepID=UPI0028AAB11A|nr:hypothetical protein [Sedimentibacter sp.]
MKAKYIVTEILCVISFIMYTIVDIIENVTPKLIVAMYNINHISFASDDYSLLFDFSFIKIIFISFTLVFGGLSVYLFIKDNKKE